MTGRATLAIKGLEVECILGDLPDERTTPRRVLVDVEIGIDVAQVAASDDLGDTVDYAALAVRIRDLLIAGRFHMIEKAVAEIARLLEVWPGVRGGSVELIKPAPLPSVAASSVRIELDVREDRAYREDRA